MSGKALLGTLAALVGISAAVLIGVVTSREPLPEDPQHGEETSATGVAPSEALARVDEVDAAKARERWKGLAKTVPRAEPEAEPRAAEPPPGAIRDIRVTDAHQNRVSMLMRLEHENAALNKEEIDPDYYLVFDEAEFSGMMKKMDRYAEVLAELGGAMEDNAASGFDPERHAALLRARGELYDKFLDELSDNEAKWLGENGFLSGDAPIAEEEVALWKTHLVPDSPPPDGLEPGPDEDEDVGTVVYSSDDWEDDQAVAEADDPTADEPDDEGHAGPVVEATPEFEHPDPSADDEPNVEDGESEDA